jgi:outer membrane protein OmpA-like peptidoglycan-associated protein
VEAAAAVPANGGETAVAAASANGKANGNGKATNGNGKATNGNGKATNGNGKATNGNGNAADDNGAVLASGKAANGNGKAVNGNGAAAANGKAANGGGAAVAAAPANGGAAAGGGAAAPAAAADDADAEAAKLTLKEQRAEIARLKAEVEQQKKELAVLKSSTKEVEEVHLRGGAAENPLMNGGRLDTVYFPPNTSRPTVVFSLPVLDEVGDKMRSDNSLVVSIRGYAAPAGTADGQRIVSETRARYCADYLNKKYGVDYERMTIEWYGATKKPEKTGVYNENGLYRAVELVTRTKDGLEMSATEISARKR